MATRHIETTRLKLNSELSKSLSSLLECPICFEFMVTPIIQCLNGHNMCSKCKPKLQICPSCRVPLTITTRNVALENIAASCLLNENNLSNTLPSQKNRIYECLAGKGYGCKWTGRRTELWSHVVKNHSRLVVQMKKNSQVFRVSNHDFTITGTNTQLVSALGHLFWYQFRQDSNNSRWYQAVQYIGSRKHANYYKYTLEYGPLPDDSMKRFISYTRVTHSDEESADNIFKAGDCFNTDLNTIKYFLSMENTLKFKVKLEIA